MDSMAALDEVYLDNAATSWPKPVEVGEAMRAFVARDAGNPGRGGHALARRAAEPIERCRTSLARMFNIADPKRLVMTHGCTDAVNQAIHGVLQSAIARCGRDKPHAVTGCCEHNAVLRTLHCYASRGLVDVSFTEAQRDGVIDIEALLDACDERTRLVCLSHASNVLGTLQPVAEVSSLVRARSPRALVLIDAAQTAGHVPVDVVRDGADLLAVAGHKGLLGPTGTGALYIGERAYPDDPDADRLFCERRGGTGAIAPGLEMPTELPDAFEAGTTNAVGFAGLGAALDHAPAGRHEHEHAMAALLREGLGSIPGVRVYGDAGAVPLVLFNVEGVASREVGAAMDVRGICVRGGTHCAPMMHRAIGTWPDGAVRASPGFATTADDVGRLIEGVRALVP